jgi:hypothetical protein
MFDLTDSERLALAFTNRVSELGQTMGPVLACFCQIASTSCTLQPSGAVRHHKTSSPGPKMKTMVDILSSARLPDILRAIAIQLTIAQDVIIELFFRPTRKSGSRVRLSTMH